MNKIISYADYRKKMKELKTPEEVSAFAQELIAPMVGRVMKDEPVEVEEMVEADVPSPKRKAYSRLNPYGIERVSPWHDVAANDTEAMVIDLYAKGLTTRDIVNHLKKCGMIGTEEHNRLMAQKKS